jgi:hypothetical protein
MIRRRMGDEFFLFTQHDHAVLSSQFASHYGNGRFLPPDPRAETISAVMLHDCGWPLHDDCPTLNASHLPLDVFETPLDLAVRVWQASAESVANESPYTRLLVSLHVLGLSGYAASHVHTRTEQFELNKFQQREIERQVELRKELGLSTDIPLRLGLAMDNRTQSEAVLKFNHNILQAMDRISLALCCTEPPFPRIENIFPRPGSTPDTLHFRRSSATSLRVEPWPFDARTLNFKVPFRSVPARPFYSVEEFREAYAAAPMQHLAVSVHM